MDEAQVLKRKVRLKQQAKKLIQDEIINLQIRLALVHLKGCLEEHLDNDFDKTISHKIDAVNLLLDT